MRLGDEAAGGWLAAAKASESAQVGAVSFGLATVMMASAASAQAPAPAPLPALDVVTKQKSKSKTKAAKQKAAPVAAAPTEDATPPAVAEPAFGTGETLTPSTGNTLQSGTGLGRLQGTLQDTPQTVNVIPQKQLKEQQAVTLDQALKAVPGVTVAIGEGGGGMNGDQFRIRGFQAKGDIYVDGLRDFGVYVRDSFAYEQVEVFKGPTSESFGMGTTGGAINIQQKTAHLGDSTSIETAIGMGPLYRTIIDVNKQINATTAARVVGMWHDQDLVDRDHLYSDRWGGLASLAFGLGTDTTLTVNYLHQSGERRPDFGVPIIDPDTATGPIVGRPVTEFGVPRSNFYGKETDIDETDVDMLTARFKTKVNDGLTIYNDTRLAMYGRTFAQTVPSCSGACLTSVLDGTFGGTYSLGGPAGFDQESWGAQNITTAVAKFHTAGLRHEFTAGIDVWYQSDERTQLGVYDINGVLQSGTGAAVKTPGTIGNPNFYNTTGYTVRKNPLALKEAEADNIGIFASDRVWLTPQISVLGGIRWDRYSASYQATDPASGNWTGGASQDVDTDSRFWSPKASIIWEPAKNQTYYASWARSYTPVGQFITNDNNSVSVTPGQSGQDPEENELWEVGAKISTPDGKLGFTGALFRVEKGNATFTDPTTGDTALSGDTQRVQGVELGVTGKITDAWSVQLAYAYLDSETLKSATAANVGNRVAFVPENAVSVWTTYEISKLFSIGPGTWTLGGGITFTDENFTNPGNTSMVPANFSLDGLISYELDGWRAALNGYNLTDELNYDASFGNRAVVSQGRSVLFTLGKKF